MALHLDGDVYKRQLFDILDQAVEEPVSLTLPTRVVRGESVKDLR